MHFLIIIAVVCRLSSLPVQQINIYTTLFQQHCCIFYFMIEIV